MPLLDPALATDPHPLPPKTSRKRALGGRYCLVCSLVARSTATTTSSNQHQTNSNVMAAPTSPNDSPVGGTPPTHRRQPLSYLGPGAVPTRRGPSVQQHQDRATAAAGKEQGLDATRLSSPVLISRSKRGGGGVAGQSQQQQQQGGMMPGSPVQQQQQCMTVSRSKFFRSLPKTRRGSWGGYDRTRYLRRTRFDSIPEEVPEEDCDDDEYDQEVSET